jgi:hypothetical protein
MRIYFVSLKKKWCWCATNLYLEYRQFALLCHDQTKAPWHFCFSFLWITADYYTLSIVKSGWV